MVSSGRIPEAAKLSASTMNWYFPGGSCWNRKFPAVSVTAVLREPWTPGMDTTRRAPAIGLQVCTSQTTPWRLPGIPENNVCAIRAEITNVRILNIRTDTYARPDFEIGRVREVPSLAKVTTYLT